jgi:hypothetical protein
VIKHADWRELWGPHGGDVSGRGLLGCYALQCCGRIPTFQRSMLPPSLPWSTTRRHNPEDLDLMQRDVHSPHYYAFTPRMSCRESIITDKQQHVIWSSAAASYTYYLSHTQRYCLMPVWALMEIFKLHTFSQRLEDNFETFCTWADGETVATRTHVIWSQATETSLHENI